MFCHCPAPYKAAAVPHKPLQKSDAVEVGVQSVTEMSPDDIKCLHEWDPAFKRVKHMVIFEDDHPRTDLLKHFPEAVHFIESALATGGKAFVHCMQGISRSATVSQVSY